MAASTIWLAPLLGADIGDNLGDPLGGKIGARFRKPGFIAIGGNDHRVRLDEPPHHHPADPARRAGDDHALSGEVEAHVHVPAMPFAL